MSYNQTHYLRKILKPYIKRSNVKAITIFILQFSCFLAAAVGTFIIKINFIALVLSILTGFIMATLFVIAHDAAHDNYTTSSQLNGILARIAFLPCLHNYTLWLIAHNKKHHLFTNIDKLNSWSPLSPEKYQKLTSWKKLLYRFYRNPTGIGFYYLIERWWKEKFYPHMELPDKTMKEALIDFTFLLSGLIIYIAFIFSIYINFPVDRSIFHQVLLSIVIPFMIFCYLVGFNVYQQHTHESIPWFKDRESRDRFINIYDTVMYVRYPIWFKISCLNVMEHTAHHIDPRIPLYNLAKAQDKLNEALQYKIPSAQFSFLEFLQTMKKCKLYDYEKQQWVNFNGIITSEIKLISKAGKFAKAA